MSLARSLTRALPLQTCSRQALVQVAAAEQSAPTFYGCSSSSSSRQRRNYLSTLARNPHIVSLFSCQIQKLFAKKRKYTAPHPSQPRTHVFTLLPTDPPTPSLALGTAPTADPDVDDFKENPDFLQLLHAVVSEHAAQDPAVQAQAAAFASQAGSGTTQLTHGAMADERQRQRSQQRQRGSTSSMVSKLAAAAQHKTSSASAAGGASAQGGMGSGGRGGFIHVADTRNPPDWGRIAWPEDILGSLELDGQGRFVDGKGRYQASGTYRVLTREGMLGISSFLREKLKARMGEVERDMRSK